MRRGKLSYQCNVPDSEFAVINGKEFCTHCQTAIADFTVMTDDEIRQYVAMQAGSVCVKIDSDQLDRVKGRRSSLRQNLAVAATATLLAFAGESKAQSADTVKTEQTENVPASGYVVQPATAVDSANVSAGEGLVKEEPIIKKRPLKKWTFLRIGRKEFYVMNKFPFFGKRYTGFRGKF